MGTRGRLAILGSALLLGMAAAAALAPAGQAATPASIAFSPALYSYGKTAVGTTASETFTLKNKGGTSTGALSLAVLGSPTFTITTDHCAGLNLGANGTCTVTVSYKPAKNGESDLTTLWAYGNKPIVVAAALLSGTGTAAVAPSADLSITDTDGASSVVAGTSTTYTITVTNHGPSAVTGATVADTMPSALAGDSYTAVGSGGASGFTASGTGNIVDTVSMPAGATITYTVKANVKSSATGSLSNTATVTAPAGVTDPNPANNSATDTDQVTQTADLTITKTDGVTSVIPGGQVTYTIVVANDGPSDVAGATVVDDMPAAIAGDTFTSVSSGGASGASASGSGSIDDSVNLPNGSSITYTVTADVAASATGSLSNTATVSAPAGVTDPNPANNTATDTKQITESADLAITKTDNDGGSSITTAQGSAVAGTSITYTIVVTNNGPSAVTGATVADTMPAAIAGDTFTSVSSGGASGASASGSGSIDDSVNLPSGSSITYTVTANIAASATGSLSNAATVTAPAGVTDPNPANNSATDTDQITRSADLTITKTDGVGSVLPGGGLTYTIVVTNDGPSGVTGATVVDDMPAALSSDTFTAVGSNGASGFTASGTGNIDDTVNLPNGSSITYTVDATVSSTATATLSLSNTATVTAPAGVTDSNPNNSATATNTIGAAASCTSNCSLDTGNSNTGALDVTATGPTGTTGTVQAAVFTGPLACTYSGSELNIDPNTYEVIASNSAFSKTIAIEFPVPSDAPPVNSSLFYIPFEADVLGNVQICFQATYPFAVRGGGSASENPSTGLYTGLLPDCPIPLSRATGPCDERLASSITNIGANGTTNYDVNETAFVPAGESGDPRMN